METLRLWLSTTGAVQLVQYNWRSAQRVSPEAQNKSIF